MRLWIDVPIHVLLPTSEKDQLLPEWRFMALLEGKQNTESGVAYSFLVVIYFQKAAYPFVSPEIELMLQTLNWDHMADHRGTDY
jgi:hypothetical protein